MRGPGSSTFTDEVAAAEAVKDLVAALADLGVEVKLGQVPAEQRPKLTKLTEGQLATMRRHHLDSVRVLLARAMVKEAENLRKMCVFPGRRTDGGAHWPRRYSDLLFSARAVLPPGYAWDDVTYTAYDGTVCWSHQLNYDGNGRALPEAGYDEDEAELLLEEFKGGERVAAG